MMQRGVTEKDRRRGDSNECKALRDIVSKLRTELLQSQVERQKLQDQLHCMIYLVRRYVIDVAKLQNTRHAIYITMNKNNACCLILPCVVIQEDATSKNIQQLVRNKGKHAKNHTALD